MQPGYAHRQVWSAFWMPKFVRSFWLAEPCGGMESERDDEAEAETTAAVADVGLESGGYVGVVLLLSGG